MYVRVCSYTCVCVCVFERERNTTYIPYPWKTLEPFSCQADLGFSPHLQYLDVFCPLKFSLCLANPGRASCFLLTGHSSDQNISRDYRKENRFERGTELPGREAWHPGGSLPRMISKHLAISRMGWSRPFPGMPELVYILYFVPRLFLGQMCPYLCFYM